MTADLHIHSNYSDGTLPPEEIVSKAKKAGLKTIALADHDTVDGVGEAIALGKKWGVEVIPAIELNTESAAAEIHILGYFIDYELAWFKDLLAKYQQGRIERVEKMAKKLEKLKVKIDPQRVFEIAGRGSVGRPHVALAMLEAGHVRSIGEAFARYLSYGKPAYIPHAKLTPQKAIEIILRVGGIPVYAHPGCSACDEVIPDFMRWGLKGIEVYYGGHTPGQTEHYLALARKYGLLITGGSDFHGKSGVHGMELGAFTISDELVEKLRKAKEKK